MQRQFTTTVYIFQDGRTLLHYHRKHNKWLPPGGHLEPGETPPEAARREVLEEVGVEIEFLEQEAVPVQTVIEKPHMCHLFDVPGSANEPAHQHIDFVYLAAIAPNQVIATEFKWFTLDEIKSMKDELFPDCLRLLEQRLQ